MGEETEDTIYEIVNQIPITEENREQVEEIKHAVRMKNYKRALLKIEELNNERNTQKEEEEKEKAKEVTQKTGEVIEATLAGSKLTVTGSAEVGDTVLVGSYKYSVEAEKVDIPASSSGRDVAITITRPQANAAQKVVCEKVWKFYRASFSTDFADEATAEKSEGAISTSFTVLKHADHENLGFFAYVPVNQG